MDFEKIWRTTQPESFSRKLKREIWHTYLWVRSFTSWGRMWPSFIIIGTQKGGTTSLYYYLLQHPQILPAIEKEIRFFDYKSHKGLAWYRGHFPTTWIKIIKEVLYQNVIITGEASPNYLFDPRPPERIKKFLPDVKIIIILRNPVDRAYSSYQMAFRRRREKLSFSEAIDAEPQRLRGEIQKINKNERYISMNRQWYAYLARGRYIEQLEPWLKNFPRDQLLFLNSRDLFLDPSKVVAKTHAFLGVQIRRLLKDNVYNSGGLYPEMDPDLRRKLTQYFLPYNQRLYQRLGMDFGWENEGIKKENL